MRRHRWLVALVAALVGTLGNAAKPVGPPTMGPLERPPRPLIVTFEARNPRDYASHGGLVAGSIGAMSDARHTRNSATVTAAIREAFPTLDVEQELRTAFRCGQEGALCSEFAVLPETATTSDLQALLTGRGWSDVRQMRFWWDANSPRLAAHAEITSIQIAEEGKLTFSQPALAGYYLVAPPRRTRDESGAPLPHEDDWEAGAALPREASIRTAIAQMEPLMQLTLSWGTNNDRATYEPHVRSRTRINKVRDQGIECTGLRQCVSEVEGMVDGDRVWVWASQRQSPNMRLYGAEVWELQSRPRRNP